MLEGVVGSLRGDSREYWGDDFSLASEIRPKLEGGIGNWRRGVDGGVGLAGVRGVAGLGSIRFFEPSAAITTTGDRVEAFWADLVCFE